MTPLSLCLTEDAHDPELEAPLFALLLGEEDAALRTALAKTLTMVGYQVTAVENGTEAKEMLAHERFPLVVLSTTLPGVEGEELLATLRESDPFAECLLLAREEDVLRVVQMAEFGNVFNHCWKPLREMGGLLRDIGRAVERRELRLSQARLLGDLRDARAELDTFHSRLEQLDKVTALGQMAESVAAELKEPLTGLSAYAQYLRARLERTPDEPLTAEQMARVVDYLQEMEESVGACRQVVAEVQGYTRLHAEPPGPVAVHEVIEAALLLTQPALEKGGHQLQRRLALELPPVLANPYKLQQILVNLLMNAVQAFGTEPGLLTITAEVLRDAHERETGVILRVADTGCGIAPDVLPRIFEPFFTTYAPSKNLGIGLTIARKIVQDWQGDLKITSSLQRGTTAHLTLPLCNSLVLSGSNFATEKRLAA